MINEKKVVVVPLVCNVAMTLKITCREADFTIDQIIIQLPSMISFNV